MSFLKKVLGGVTGVLNTVAPFASMIPGMQWVTIAAMAANVAQGLMQKPPQWGAILGNLAMQMIPMGFGKALKSFGAAFPNGGTAMNFAEHLSGGFSSVLKDVAAKVGPRFGPQFAQQIEAMSAKFASPEYLQKFADVVSKATGTEPGAILTADRIAQAAERIGPELANITGGFGSQLGYALEQGASNYREQQPQPVVIPSSQSGQPLDPGPTVRVNQPFKG